MAENTAAIKDYFIVGNLHTAALVSKEGSIDWMCVPNFDSPSIFARILDKNAGYFGIDAPDHQKISRYLPNTAIVETKFKRGKEEFLVRDFMVPNPTKICKNHLLVRKIISLSKESTAALIFNPKPNYSRGNFLIIQKANSLILNLKEGLLMLHFPANITINIFFISVYTTQSQDGTQPMQTRIKCQQQFVHHFP